MRQFRRWVLTMAGLLAAALGLASWYLNEPLLLWSPSLAHMDASVVAAGDIAGCWWRGDEATARLMRSQVDLLPSGASGLGRVVVHGAGKKLGVTRDLTPEERGAIDRALSSYLKHLEEGYQLGLREDYPIFPGGRLKYDIPPSRWPKRTRPGLDERPTRRAKPSVSNRPIGKRGLLDFFHQLEEIARVTPVPGRGWYGIRRPATDVYEDYETDERVRNDQTGHRSSDTRREVYQEREREEIRARSAETRRRVRSAAFGREPQGMLRVAPKRPVKRRTRRVGAATHTPPHTPAPPIIKMRRGWRLGLNRCTTNTYDSRDGRI